MEVTKNLVEDAMTVAVAGRLDTSTSPQLENDLKAVPEAVKRLTLDFSRLEYISSAGLRVVLNTHKIMKARGCELALTGLNATVRRVFDITGFSPILKFV